MIPAFVVTVTTGPLLTTLGDATTYFYSNYCTTRTPTLRPTSVHRRLRGERQPHLQRTVDQIGHVLVRPIKVPK